MFNVFFKLDYEVNISLLFCDWKFKCFYFRVRVIDKYCLYSKELLFYIRIDLVGLYLIEVIVNFVRNIFMIN